MLITPSLVDTAYGTSKACASAFATSKCACNSSDNFGLFGINGGVAYFVVCVNDNVIVAVFGIGIATRVDNDIVFGE